MSWRGHNYLGALFSFVGVEASGKTTQRQHLEKYLVKEDFSVKVCKDPHGDFRRFLLDPESMELHPKSELLVFMGGRAEVVETEMKPALEQGQIVLYEQYIDASKAYQGYGLGLSLEIIDKLNAFVTDNIMPDLTFLHDSELKRIRISTDEFGKQDKIEARGLEFHNKVRQGYLEMADIEPERFRIISYEENRAGEMQTQIRKYVNEFIEEHNLRQKLLRVSEYEK